MFLLLGETISSFPPFQSDKTFKNLTEELTCSQALPFPSPVPGPRPGSIVYWERNSPQLLILDGSKGYTT